MRKAYKFRLSPTKKQEKLLFWTLTRCRELYNAALSERRDAYRMAGKSISYYEQKRDLVALGAYAKGSEPKLDAALARIERIEAFLRQDAHSAFALEQTLAMLDAPNASPARSPCGALVSPLRWQRLSCGSYQMRPLIAAERFCQSVEAARVKPASNALEPD